MDGGRGIEEIVCAERDLTGRPPRVIGDLDMGWDLGVPAEWSAVGQWRGRRGCGGDRCSVCGRAVEVRGGGAKGPRLAVHGVPGSLHGRRAMTGLDDDRLT